MFELVGMRPVAVADVRDFAELSEMASGSPDLGSVGDLMVAVRDGAHDPTEWKGEDCTRRSVFRILARAVQLGSPTATGWTRIFTDVLAYGDLIGSDPVFAKEIRAQAWRGVLLRHHSVGAWRRLWSCLVDRVLDADDGPVSKDDLHEWIRSCVSGSSVRKFMASCPDTVDSEGQPQAAEDELRRSLGPVEADLAILMLGAKRNEQLPGVTREAFRGGRSGRQFLDPNWIGYRCAEHLDLPLADFACAIVDDMLAQSRRVALRKMTVDTAGRMVLFTKLEEREGRYFASGAEGSGNVGLRIEQLGTLATQLGLFDELGSRRTVTELGCDLLGLPR
ncbi:hypothetical protein ACIBCN_17300 [Nocardia sp. NPDC051052]|uniref:hypothetical protein n=1 Tax=Nocardia sp. NPDC051052 TaxID=3364322 RepID=UPI00378D62EC